MLCPKLNAGGLYRCETDVDVVEQEAQEFGGVGRRVCHGASSGEEVPPGSQDRERILRRHLPWHEYDHWGGGTKGRR